MNCTKCNMMLTVSEVAVANNAYSILMCSGCRTLYSIDHISNLELIAELLNKQNIIITDLAQRLSSIDDTLANILNELRRR